MTERSQGGKIARTSDGGAVIEFEWYYDRPVEAVWAALTEPERLALWIADADVDLRVGGHYRLFWRGANQGSMEGVIVELDPPRLLAHTWSELAHGQSTVRWELVAAGAGCLLRLTHTFAPGNDAVPFLAGWHDFLYSLLAAIDGYRSAYDPDREQQIDAHYRFTNA